MKADMLFAYFCKDCKIGFNLTGFTIIPNFKLKV